MTTDDVKQFLTDMEFSCLEKEDMQRDIRELSYVLQNLAPKSRVLRSVVELKMFLEDHKLGINECAQRPENIMEKLKEVSNRLQKRRGSAGKRQK